LTKKVIKGIILVTNLSKNNNGGTMKKILLAFLLIAILVVGGVSTSTTAASADEVMAKLAGYWILKQTGGMYQEFNMIPPGDLWLTKGGKKWRFSLTIKGKGKFQTKGDKWEVKVPAETGGDATIYCYQSHVFNMITKQWVAKEGKAAGPVEFKEGKIALISFLDLAKYSVPEAGNDYISLTWEKKKDY